MALPQSQQQNKPILRLHQTQEAKKVSVDDGFTAIPNELLFAMGRFPFTQRQYAVILAVIQKTLSWRKEMDWICNEQLCELTGIKGEHKVSAVKNELVRMKVLTQKGRKIGLNLIISEWENPNLPEKGNLTQKGKTNLPEKGNRVYPKQVNTKETITKEKINRVTNVTLSSDDDLQAVENEEQSAKTVAAEKAKPKAKTQIDYQAIADAYNAENEETGSRLPNVVAVNDKRKRAIKKFLGELKHPTVECAVNYFVAFFEKMKPHHEGQNDRGWRASFDFAIRPDVVLRVRENNL
ncbi:phage replication protein O, N-terminal domain [Actinobacillus lignieresii]|uniref:replication protein n=1 Tax=Actinobacillus lignieresii TaxID=720 RepID=UPI000F6D0A4A|nr:replication protein [Actinobacillus lignieresii]VEB26189.1 phage replication protein O, N-terminal domain [Actinobacillus lignieresii]